MKRSKILYTFLALVMVATAVYAIDYNANKASVLSLPNFSGTTNVASADEKPVGTLREFNDAIVDIADQTTPTVVTVRVTQTVEVPENPFSRFFGMPEEGGRERLRRGLGSGVIVSEDGYILTNNHVVEGAEEITVDLSNGESYDGKVIGRDPQTDIAVVKINADDLQAIEIGDSDDVRVGEMVLAIGSPLNQNLAHSVSMGIISAKERSIGIIENGGYETFLQTDAAINPGNSGGALVNMDGELIGINTAIASRTGGNDGIGFAVPSNLAKSIMESLIKDGKVTRAQLGIYGRDIDRTLAQAFGLKSSQGILVSGVLDDSPASRAGLQEGDVIKTLDGEAVGNYNIFRTTIATMNPGKEVTLGIIRDSQSMEIEVTLGERNLAQEASGQNPNGNTDMQKNLGFSIDNLSPRITQQLELKTGTQGVVVTNVNEASNAAQKGLQRGAVIISVNKQPIDNVNDFTKEINKLADKEDAVVLLHVIPPGAPEVKQYIAFEL